MSLYVLLLLLLLLLLPRLLLASPCTHYAAPNGPGDGSSVTQPFTISAFWPVAQPGSVLCLIDGVYTGSANMLDAPATLAGTAAQRITIRALTDGLVTLDGEDQRRPADLEGAYGVLEGINVTRGDNSNLALRGSDWIVRRVVSWDVGHDGDTNIRVEGHRNLVEDCAAFGAARKQIAAGAGGAGRRFNTIRRCWTRWEANLHQTSNPTVSLEIGYGQDTVWAENMLGTWDTLGRITEPEGVLELFATQDSTLLASIFYVPPGAVYHPAAVVFATSDAGSHWQQGDYHPTSGVRIAQLVTWLPPALATKESARFSVATSGPAGGPNWVTDLTAIGGTPPTFTTNWSPSGIRHGATLAAATGGGVLWEQYAGLCRQVVAGQLTSTPLWPWPMNARIVAAMQQAGVPPVDVTAQMEALLGPIPPACRPGTPPQPSPAVVLEYALDGGQTWQPAATLPAVPPALCLRLTEGPWTSTRLCLEQPPTDRKNAEWRMENGK
jgi:hypothetical protein